MFEIMAVSRGHLVIDLVQYLYHSENTRDGGGGALSCILGLVIVETNG